ncbi:MAG: Holliday junction branch migration protein RuvA, partial [Acidocella sp. 20-58-15]
MIAKLRGLIDNIEDGKCIVDVNGVGYLVFCSSRTLTALPNPPGIASLLIETQVREDAISLYGFGSSAERDWFRLLTTVQGVGAKVALA